MAASSDSKRLQSYSRKGLSAAAAGIVIAVAAGWFVASKQISSLDSHKLQDYRQSLHSYIAETILLTTQYRQGRATENYTKVSAEKLYDGTDDIVTNLQNKTPGTGLAQRIEQTRQQANDLLGNLAQLSKSPTKTQLGDISNDLNRLKRQVNP